MPPSSLDVEIIQLPSYREWLPQLSNTSTHQVYHIDDDFPRERLHFYHPVVVVSTNQIMITMIT